MPFYEYQCSACGAQVEVLQKISDAPLKKCGECGRNQLKKLVSAPVFRLKGGGWYETDFKSDQDRKRNLVDNDKDAGGKEDKPAEKSGDAAAEKPATGGESGSGAKPAAKDPAPAAKPRPARRSVAAKPVRAAPKKAAAKPARAPVKR